MINDRPIEWITKIEEKPMHKALRIFCLAAAIAMILVFLGIPWMFFLVVFGVFLVLFFLLQFRAVVEYEFTWFADELRIVAIYNQKRRKKKMVVSLAEIQYMVKKIEPGDETIYFCERSDEGNTYSLAVNQEGKRKNLILCPDPTFADVLQRKRLVR